MLPIPQVHLEPLDRRAGAGGIQFPGTVAAADAREPHVLDITRRLCFSGRDGHLRRRVDGEVAHHPLEAVLGVRLLQSLEAGYEPCWWWWLVGVLVGYSN